MARRSQQIFMADFDEPLDFNGLFLADYQRMNGA